MPSIHEIQKAKIVKEQLTAANPDAIVFVVFGDPRNAPVGLLRMRQLLHEFGVMTEEQALKDRFKNGYSGNWGSMRFHQPRASDDQRRSMISIVVNLNHTITSDVVMEMVTFAKLSIAEVEYLGTTDSLKQWYTDYINNYRYMRLS